MPNIPTSNVISTSRRLLWTLSLILCLALVLAACGGDTEQDVPTAEPPEQEETQTQEPASEQTEEPEDSPIATPEDRGAEETSPVATPLAEEDVPEELVDRASQQLAEEIDADVDAISVAEAEAVEWPDASLGCPEPDMVYAQVVTPGYRIVLDADGEQYEFHTERDAGGQIILCDQ